MNTFQTIVIREYGMAIESEAIFEKARQKRVRDNLCFKYGTPLLSFWKRIFGIWFSTYSKKRLIWCIWYHEKSKIKKITHSF